MLRKKLVLTALALAYVGLTSSGIAQESEAKKLARLGVTGFTYDPSIGEFFLSHRDIQTPKQGHTYSINEGNYLKFPSGVKQYINTVRKLIRPPSGPIPPDTLAPW